MHYYCNYYPSMLILCFVIVLTLMDNIKQILQKIKNALMIKKNYLM